MVEDLEADPALRGGYQFWTFRYASGDSIPYSAHLLRQALRRARRVFDPDGTDAAFDRMVVVGHSLGGILAKMMVQSSGSRLWQTVGARPIDQVGGPPEERPSLQQAFCYKPVPEVSRVIFITTPHRGSPLASGRLREAWHTALRRTKPLSPGPGCCWRSNKHDRFTRGFHGEFATSVNELAPGHRLRWPSATWGSIRRSAPIRSSRTFVTRPVPVPPTGSSPIRARTWTASPPSRSSMASTFACTIPR